CAARVDKPCGRVAQDDAVVRIQEINAKLEVIWQAHVVVCCPLKIFPDRKVDAPIVVRRGTQILRVPEITYPRVLAHEFPADFFRAVRGGVVRNNQLEVGEGLNEDRIERMGEIVLTVVDGDRDTYTRHEPLIEVSCRTKSPCSAAE